MPSPSSPRAARRILASLVPISVLAACGARSSLDDLRTSPLPPRDGGAAVLDAAPYDATPHHDASSGGPEIDSGDAQSQLDSSNVSDASNAQDSSDAQDACVAWLPPDNAAHTVVDGFSVWFEALPASDITTGLTPTALSPAAHFSEGPTNGWGATNPFQYSPALNGSEYDALWAGQATYAYGAAQAALEILWGTIDSSNAVSFLDANGMTIGTISGKDLATAAQATLGAGYVWADGVHIAVSVPSTFTTAIIIGGPDLTFEYANLVATPKCVP